jgi:nitroreductase
MSEEAALRAVPVPAYQVDFLIATAARAPSVHNTQPWRFRVVEFAIELYAGVGRKLRTDPLGREMLISCGAALFGLRLAVRSLGYLPVVELFPDPAKLQLLARVRLGAAAPMTARERQMLEAVPHRHTHRGLFDPGPLPAGLLAGLQHDALAEGATLAPVNPGIAYQQLAEIVGAAGRRQTLDPVARADTRRRSRGAADSARDGVPAHAFPTSADHQPGAAATA